MSRRNAAIILIIITLGLVGGAIYLSTQVIQEEQTPDDTSAAGGRNVCGDSCVTDSDCFNGTGVSDHGVVVACRGGICEAAQCPQGRTVYGAICECEVHDRTCGQRCGYWSGSRLCSGGAIPSSCTYVDGPSCSNQPNGGRTYCVPTTNPDVERLNCVARDTNNRYALQISTGVTSFATDADVEALCFWCGNSIIDSGEQCDDGNTVSGDGCSATCTSETTTECSDGIDNDGDGFIDCTPGAPDPGCFPDGNGGGGACNPLDDSELDVPNVTECSDGIDNDGDGYIDCTAGAPDPGCFPNGNGGGGACNPLDDSELDVLPDTALFDDTTDAVLIGMLLILLGLIVNRLDGFANLVYSAFSLEMTESKSKVKVRKMDEDFQSAVLKQQESKLD